MGRAVLDEMDLTSTLLELPRPAIELWAFDPATGLSYITRGIHILCILLEDPGPPRPSPPARALSARTLFLRALPSYLLRRWALLSDRARRIFFFFFPADVGGWEASR